MYEQVCGSKIHKSEEECESSDVNLANFLCPVYEITKVGHGCVEVGGAVVEADLHHLLDQLDLCESTLLLVTLTKCLVSICRCETVCDALSFG